MIPRKKFYRPTKQQMQWTWAGVSLWCSRNSKASSAEVSEGKVTERGCS